MPNRIRRAERLARAEQAERHRNTINMLRNVTLPTEDVVPMQGECCMALIRYLEQVFRHCREGR